MAQIPAQVVNENEIIMAPPTQNVLPPSGQMEQMEVVYQVRPQSEVGSESKGVLDLTHQALEQQAQQTAPPMQHAIIHQVAAASGAQTFATYQPITAQYTMSDGHAPGTGQVIHLASLPGMQGILTGAPTFITTAPDARADLTSADKVEYPPDVYASVPNLLNLVQSNQNNPPV